jgi:hypothetical protein
MIEFEDAVFREVFLITVLERGWETEDWEVVS